MKTVYIDKQGITYTIRTEVGTTIEATNVCDGIERMRRLIYGKRGGALCVVCTDTACHEAAVPA